MAFYSPLATYTEDKDENYYPGKQAWIASRLLTLRHDLYHKIKKDCIPNSLVIGSWNIRAFDGGMPRLDESYHYIAEIIDQFDICAIQEVKSDLKPLRRLKKLLGPNWDFFVSDVSVHEGGNNERIAFMYNTDKVFFRNLIGEIVLAREELIGGQNQIARSPFFASFQAGWFRFSVCSAHIIFGDDLNLRAQEISAIANALVKRSKKENQVHIFLGDMNIHQPDDDVMKALHDSEMQVPEFGATNMDGKNWFDHMAFTTKGKAGRKTRLLRHGVFDWRHAVYGPHPRDEAQAPSLSEEDLASGKHRPTLAENLAHYGPIVEAYRIRHDKKPYSDWPSQYKNWMTHEISDHLPIWMELETDYSDEFLQNFL